MCARIFEPIVFFLMEVLNDQEYPFLGGNLLLMRFHFCRGGNRSSAHPARL
jgi:hypothetical protein